MQTTFDTIELAPERGVVRFRRGLAIVSCFFNDAADTLIVLPGVGLYGGWPSWSARLGVYGDAEKFHAMLMSAVEYGLNIAEAMADFDEKQFRRQLEAA
jgi:hypothetical protein